MKQRFSYDFHIHSCLSPCADNDMTPGNIAGMASLAELRIVALTDHNTCRNCPGFMQAAERCSDRMPTAWTAFRMPAMLWSWKWRTDRRTMCGRRCSGSCGAMHPNGGDA